MKILFLGPNLAAGGAERQWSILLPALRERGYDVHLIALDGGGPFAEPIRRAGVPLEVLNMRHQAHLGPLLRSAGLRNFNPDLIVTRGVSGLYVGQVLARWRGAHHIFNEHRSTALPLTRRRELMVRLLARRIDLVIAVTPAQGAAWLARRYPRGRVVVVENGTEPVDVPESREEIRAQLGIPESAVIATLVATLRPEKHVADFVTAVRKARESDPNLVGVVVGDGPDRPAVEAAAGADPGIHLLGYRKDVPQLLKASDVFVLSSVSEAAPMAILEAMAAGLPVVSTNVGGIDTIVTAGHNGLLVPPRAPAELAAALVQVAADPDLRASMGAAGAELHRERYGAKTMIEGYVRIFEAVAAGESAQLPDAHYTNHGASQTPRS